MMPLRSQFLWCESGGGSDAAIYMTVRRPASADENDAGTLINDSSCLISLHGIFTRCEKVPSKGQVEPGLGHHECNRPPFLPPPRRTLYIHKARTACDV
jgi:hypothetical protein